RSPFWAAKFLDQWCRAVMRSRIGPMKKVAQSLRQHQPLILNWFVAKGTISAGKVEGLNNKVKLTMSKSYGFRTEAAITLALYHNLGALPELEPTHRFC
ncbi:MAG TPA: transposase, partial [Pyrinomonadaceae bacterium]|nr:transposase [Pyrinomonadaceae bacterium]